MPLKTKRWNEPIEPDDGFRLLITRYRPRGVSKADETWNQWRPELARRELHAAVYTETSSPIPWPQYRRHYLQEQRKNSAIIEDLTVPRGGRGDDHAALLLRLRAGKPLPSQHPAGID